MDEKKDKIDKNAIIPKSKVKLALKNKEKGK